MKKVNQEKISRPENIIYKDKDVTVSRFSLQVGQALYPLENISDCHVASISPNRKPAILMMAIGAVIVGVAYKELLPTNLFDGLPPIEAYGFSVSHLKLIEGLGVSIAVIGLFALIMARTLHTLRVDMGGNVIDAIITRRRDYVKKIAVATGIALRNIPSKPAQNKNTTPVQPPYMCSELK